MKYEEIYCLMAIGQSHPSRGGWIEISGMMPILIRLYGPTPHGVGGLKFDLSRLVLIEVLSHPSRGGWIEILAAFTTALLKALVPPLTGWVD